MTYANDTHATFARILADLGARFGSRGGLNAVFAELLSALFGIGMRRADAFALQEIGVNPAEFFAGSVRESAAHFDFENALLYYTSADLSGVAPASTGHKNLGFALVPCDSHKTADLVAATKAANRALNSYCVVFFVGADGGDLSGASSSNSNLPRATAQNFAQNFATAQNFAQNFATAQPAQPAHPVRLSIAFATRRFSRQTTLKKDILDKIIIVKDIALAAPSLAQLLNLESLREQSIRAIAECATTTRTPLDEFYAGVVAAFGVRELNARFYAGVVEIFARLLGECGFPAGTSESDKRAFCLRLICRLLFCKFIEKKGLIDEDLWDVGAAGEDYYRGVLEPLFFATLNTPQNERDYFKFGVTSERLCALLNAVPYLNGGLFAAQENDFFGEHFLAQLVVPNGCVAAFFELLAQYHFSIDEGSERVWIVGLNPELLGLVFENLLAQLFDGEGASSERLAHSLRKSTGSYYTPREIVGFMVRESLCAYLARASGISAGRLRAVFDDDGGADGVGENAGGHLPNSNLDGVGGENIGENISQNADDNAGENGVSQPPAKTPAPLTPAEKSQILSALKSLKIFDPACGSGAFPMGILNEILALQEKLGDTRRAYERKLEILRECIYGADIQPMATEIARLRCFLSLIIDENPRDTQPLPNLEFKFICANSLLPLPAQLTDHKGERTLESYEYERGLEALRGIRRETFLCHDKAALRARYEAAAQGLAQALFFTDASDTPLTQWQPFNAQSVAGFFDSEFMFGVSDFDIVIGNPPYGAKISPRDKAAYKAHYKHANIGSIDTYKLFIEKGFDLLKKNGFLNFIVPITITSSKSNTNLHKFLLANCEQIAVSSYGHRPIKIFHNAEQRVSIIGFVKTNSRAKSLLTTKINRRYSNQTINAVLEKMSFVNSLDFVQDGAFCKIGLPIERTIMQKLYAQKFTLKDFMQGAERVYYRTSGGGYYDIYTSYPTQSSKEKYFAVSNSKAIVAIMSSTLFWWFRNTYSNSRDSYIFEFERFPIPKFSDETLDKLRKLGELYENDIEKNTDFSNGVKTYKIRKSKHLIDQIDRLICPLYALTPDETEFIINYELEFRTDNKGE